MNTEPLHWSFQFPAIIIPLLDLFIRLGLSIRVIMRQRQYGVTLAWLVVILLLPFLGALIYLLFGENRIGEKRSSRAEKSLNHYMKWLESLQEIAPVNWSELNPGLQSIHWQATSLVGIPAMAGNQLTLIEDPERIMRSIIDDINGAKSTCHMQFYIWHEGGTADEVATALIRAAQRGVTCRILVDSIGSNDFLKGKKIKEMRAAGIHVVEELPAGFFKALFVRVDIRNHRKVVIIDGKIAYTGSQNMVDPRYFKQDEGVGRWVDIMLRIRGPVVESLAGTFIGDWYLEADELAEDFLSLEKDIDHIRATADVHHQPAKGDVVVQLVPSGPGFVPESIYNLLLTTIYASRKSITLTTPYFVPDESILTALHSAAQRGVDVLLILPEKNDSRLVHYASWARYESLLKSGVRIKLFHGGLLHSKTITVDDEFALFGSVNLDMRSFWLNFEATLFIYSRSFTEEIRQIQTRYETQSRTLLLENISDRSRVKRFMENLALIIGPLL